MKFKLSEIIDRIGEIILNPKTFWKSQKETDERLSVLLGGHFLPLLLVVVLVVFLGEFFRSPHFYAGFALLKALYEVVFLLLLYFVSVFIANELLETFGGEKKIRITYKLITYSLTPFLMISMLTGLIPYLNDLNILGIYSIYVFWIGGKEFVEISGENKERYLMITIVVIIFIFIFLSTALPILFKRYFNIIP